MGASNNETNGIGKAENIDLLARLPSGSSKWVSSVGGGVASAIATFLLVILPVVNTWLANAKEVSLAQLKVAQEQLDYREQRRSDAEKERDLYRSEMLSAQKQARETEGLLYSCQRELREYKK